ncbi:MAG: hypothetical protein ACPGUV_12375 [Polyangiales bacterium]
MWRQRADMRGVWPLVGALVSALGCDALQNNATSKDEAGAVAKTLELPSFSLDYLTSRNPAEGDWGCHQQETFHARIEGQDAFDIEKMVRRLQTSQANPDIAQFAPSGEQSDGVEAQRCYVGVVQYKIQLVDEYSSPAFTSDFVIQLLLTAVTSHKVFNGYKEEESASGVPAPGANASPDGASLGQARPHDLARFHASALEKHAVFQESAASASNSLASRGTLGALLRAEPGRLVLQIRQGESTSPGWQARRDKFRVDNSDIWMKHAGAERLWTTDDMIVFAYELQTLPGQKMCTSGSGSVCWREVGAAALDNLKDSNLGKKRAGWQCWASSSAGDEQSPSARRIPDNIVPFEERR